MHLLLVLSMALTGTPLNMLHKKSMLLDYAACMTDGLSIRKMAATWTS